MKVKTFTGTHRVAVDKQVNDWLAESKVHVRRTSTAFHRFRDRGKDALTGRMVARHGVGIAISVWYDEHPAKPQIKFGWSGKVGQRPGSRTAPKSSASARLRGLGSQQT